MSRRGVILVVSVVAAGLSVAVTSTGGQAGAQQPVHGTASVVGIRYYLDHPDSAPAALQARFRTAHDAVTADAAGVRPAAAASDRTSPDVPHVFNRDTDGLPQNEEAVSVCPRDPRTVISGTNDYRGLIDQDGNFTGWYYSQDAGATVDNEGLLPTVTTASGDTVPSGGDPTFAFAKNCDAVFAASIDYGSGATGATPSAEAVYRSTPDRLHSCPQGGSGGTLTHGDCWPTRRTIATAAPGHFIDKDWLATGNARNGGYVWIAFDDLSEFNAAGNEEAGTVEIVRCTPDLVTCTAPIPLSTGQKVAEYPTVTIGADGRTYVTWGEFFGDSFIGPAQRGWVAVADPGSTTFTTHPIYKENQVIRAQETLHANAFRVGTMFKNTVTTVDGHPEILAVWDRCRLHAKDQVCEEAEIAESTSADLGRTWSAPKVISAGGDNVFPFLTTDPTTHQVLGVWYTNRFDPVFHNRQDVEFVRLSPTGDVQQRRRLTRYSNETEADPTLGGAFIGDYIQVDAADGVAYVGYNANARSERYLGSGVPVPQQDNYLVRVHE
jgi:hypothetical protein